MRRELAGQGESKPFEGDLEEVEIELTMITDRFLFDNFDDEPGLPLDQKRRSVVAGCDVTSGFTYRRDQE